MRKSAIWSDSFFAYVPAVQAYDDHVGTPHDDPAMREAMTAAAREFKDGHPDCPYDLEWLVNNFLARV